MNLFEEMKRIYIPISKKKFKRRFMDLSEIAMIADIIKNNQLNKLTKILF